MNNDTIAAIATPFGQGAIAVIRVSGPEARAVVGGICSGRLKPVPRVQQLETLKGEDGSVVDEVLVTFFEGPKSYTGEDVVEIGCHGGVLVTRRIYELILGQGARPANPGEFTQRAFLDGKMDLTQAEAVMDLISAQTDLAMKAANEQLSGRLGGAMREVREELLASMAHVEAYIDFPEEDIDPETGEAMDQRLEAVEERLRKLLATADQGRILREGVRTVIFGAPNVGKSSLLNWLLGFERAIVSKVAGTTRDTIEEVINLKGIPLRLIDTAGVRESEDSIEKEGIERAQAQIQTADLVLSIFDVSEPKPAMADAQDIPDAKRRLVILNKSDLGEHESWRSQKGIRISCLEADGMEELVEAIFECLTRGDVPWGEESLVAINARHKSCLQRALNSTSRGRSVLQAGESPELVAFELREAMEAVGEVVGHADVEELLGEIFGAFCIGK